MAYQIGRERTRQVKEYLGIMRPLTERLAITLGYADRNDLLQRTYPLVIQLRNEINEFANQLNNVEDPPPRLTREQRYNRWIARNKIKRYMKRYINRKYPRKTYSINLTIEYDYKLQDSGRIYPINGSFYTDGRREYSTNITSRSQSSIENQIERYKQECLDDTINYLTNCSHIFDFQNVRITTFNQYLIDEPDGNLADVRMNNAFMFKLDGDSDDYFKWNKNMGRCVYDYIIRKYNDKPGLKKICKTYESLNLHIRELTNKHFGLYDGLSTNDLDAFCRRHQIPLYAMNEDEHIFKYYVPDYNRGRMPALIYRVINNHFYPVEDNSKRNSISKMVVNATWRGSLIKTKKERKKDIDYEIEIYTGDFMEFFVRKIKETRTFPFPFKNINCVGTKLNSFILKNVKYVSSTIENKETCELVCKNMNTKYKGQSISGILNEIIDTIEPLPTSYPNPDLYEVFTKDGVKHRVHNGWVDEFDISVFDNPLSTFHSTDISKCYLNCMYNPIAEWMTIDFNDNREPYNGELTPGFYTIDTDDKTLLHGSNIYSHTILKEALKHNIKFTIIEQIKPKTFHSKDLFKPYINKIQELCEHDSSKWKLVVNSLSGLLGKHQSKTTKCRLNSDYKGSILNWFKNNAKDQRDIMITDLNINDTKYYLYGINQKVNLTTINIPMYIQIKDQANIELFNMIKEMVGQVVYRKTDMAIVMNGKYPKLSTDIGGYRACDIPTKFTNGKYNDIQFEEHKQWFKHNIHDSSEWKKMYDIATNEGGLLITGRPGDGKSYASKHICDKLGDKIKRLAPTHKACLHINGETIHSFIKITDDKNSFIKVVKNIASTYDYIYIDEISMIDKKIWKLLCEMKRLTNITFILSGDPDQLEPVGDDLPKERHYFNHPVVKYLVNYNLVELNVNHRFDKDLKKVLIDFKAKGNINTQDYKCIKDTDYNICFYNGTRKLLNNKYNMKYKTNDAFMLSHTPTDEYTQDTWIYKGLPIISRVTMKDRSQLNNEEYIIEECNQENIICKSLERDNHVITIDTNDFQKLFMMSYAISTYKAQGSTVTKDYTIYDWNDMNKKMKYTALSRARRIDQIQINTNVSKSNYEEFKKTIENKIRGHKEYDIQKGFYEEDKFITLPYIYALYKRHHGHCSRCCNEIKISNYESRDPLQISIDRYNDKIGHIKKNVCITCWHCNLSKYK